ncbi:P-loop containing nucleoside triphosphate hydrolase protein [Xylogone sp. PMI_703]|nr:P-loop containing nucleoside triphosphate hydrolase protein [Xylogone sp. PMI_703]
MNPEIQMVNPRYMIDISTYRQMHLDESQLLLQHDDLGLDLANVDDPPSDTFLLLLPANIVGFGFNDKKWRTLLVEHMSDIVWNTKAFDRLVIVPDKRELIEALVTAHTNTTKSTDIIEGKGNGLIMLLHGAPGTGKTLTAESVAEYTKRPLYRITCGDIGTNAEEVEKYLESVLHLGTLWKCVVLLDEADVFLEERTQTDLKRNALVSVFLRILEYYDGILILTSNRVGTFDEAFISRVQLALYYPPLSQNGREEIWCNFIHGLRETNPDAKIEELLRKVEVLARNELNGREIRNTVKTAMQLAQFKGKNLSYSHFEKVIQVSGEFGEYLNDTRGYNLAEYARAEKIRRD